MRGNATRYLPLWQGRIPPHTPYISPHTNAPDQQSKSKGRTRYNGNVRNKEQWTHFTCTTRTTRHHHDHKHQRDGMPMRATRRRTESQQVPKRRKATVAYPEQMLAGLKAVSSLVPHLRVERERKCKA